MTTPARERAVSPVTLPASLTPLVRGYDWARDLVGEAGATVYRLFATGRPTLYLKHGAAEVAADVIDEMVRLEWLGRSLTVPAVHGFVAVPGDAWLLMTALPGGTALEYLVSDPESRSATVVAVAQFLRALHALPIATCPFNTGHALRLAEASYRLEAGQVDATGFDGRHRGWTPAQVWDEVTGLLPLDADLPADLVVTHGDYSLDNILLENGQVTGCIDVGRAGIADRYQDLAILWHCLGEFGERARDMLWSTYGIASPDERKIAFHLSLDELF